LEVPKIIARTTHNMRFAAIQASSTMNRLLVFVIPAPFFSLAQVKPIPIPRLN